MHKILLCGIAICAYSTVHAADLTPTSQNKLTQLSKEDRSEIKDRIRQLQFAFTQGPTYFQGSSTGLEDFIDTQVNTIQTVFDRYGVSYTSPSGTRAWFEDAKKDLLELKKSKKNHDNIINREICDITGLDKAQVLKALVDAAHYQNPLIGNLVASSGLGEGRMSVYKKAVEGTNCKIEYFNGKPIKVDLSRDTFDARLFDRDNGAGAAWNAINKLRQSKE